MTPFPPRLPHGTRAFGPTVAGTFARAAHVQLRASAVLTFSLLELGADWSRSLRALTRRGIDLNTPTKGHGANRPTLEVSVCRTGKYTTTYASSRSVSRSDVTEEASALAFSASIIESSDERHRQRLIALCHASDSIRQ